MGSFSYLFKTYIIIYGVGGIFSIPAPEGVPNFPVRTLRGDGGIKRFKQRAVKHFQILSGTFLVFLTNYWNATAANRKPPPLPKNCQRPRLRPGRRWGWTMGAFGADGDDGDGRPRARGESRQMNQSDNAVGRNQKKPT